MTRFLSVIPFGGGREFYGSLGAELQYDATDSQTNFENGDLAYWYSGNGLCLLYDNQVESPEIESGVIVFGKITSNLDTFHQMEDQIEVTVSLAEDKASQKPGGNQ